MARTEYPWATAQRIVYDNEIWNPPCEETRQILAKCVWTVRVRAKNSRFTIEEVV